MRVRRIARTYDNLSSQSRVVLVMECKHYVSIDEKTWHAHPEVQREVARGFFECEQCPAPEFAETQSKTASQLWKEAGEP